MPVQIPLAVLADGANKAGGKLNLLGVFDQVTAIQFPARHPACFIALGFLFDIAEQGQKRILKIILMDEDGHSLFEIEGEMQIPAIRPDTAREVNYDIIPIQDMILPKPGHYSFKVSVDGHHYADIPFTVKKIEAMPNA